jgi:PAS domain-containing protein
MQLIVYDSGGFWQARMRLLYLFALSAVLLTGQKMVSARAGLIYYAEGAITVDGQIVRASSIDRRPLLRDGQTVVSTRGHAEILLGPHAVLWTGTQAQVRFDNTTVEHAEISILTGTAMLEIRTALTDSQIVVHVGTEVLTLVKSGLYRLGAAGAAAVKDEFHYWCAYRSFQLEVDAGRFEQWHGSELRKHAGFDVTFPPAPGAARVKYLAASEAGLVYFLQGGAAVGGQTRTSATRLPMLIGAGNLIHTEVGKAELFLGVGIVARLAEHSRLRMLDSHAEHPVIVMEAGEVLIEVANSSEDTHLRVQLGESQTELQKPGLYRFDVATGALRIYGGESTTTLGSSTMRAKEGQRVALQAASPPAKFDVKQRDIFFQWTADRSFALYNSGAGFMTGWQPAPVRTRLKHKQYGERQVGRGRSRY